MHQIGIVNLDENSKEILKRDSEVAKEKINSNHPNELEAQTLNHALLYALLENDLDLVKKLLDCVDLNSDNNVCEKPAIFFALEYSNGHVFEYLLSHPRTKIDVQDKNNNNNTALHYAAKHNLEQKIHLLLENGASFHLKNNEGESAYDLIEKTIEDFLKHKIIKKLFLFANKKIPFLSVSKGLPFAILAGTVLTLGMAAIGAAVAILSFGMAPLAIATASVSAAVFTAAILSLRSYVARYYQAKYNILNTDIRRHFRKMFTKGLAKGVLRALLTPIVLMHAVVRNAMPATPIARLGVGVVVAVLAAATIALSLGTFGLPAIIPLAMFGGISLAKLAGIAIGATLGLGLLARMTERFSGYGLTEKTQVSAFDNNNVTDALKKVGNPLLNQAVLFKQHNYVRVYNGVGCSDVTYSIIEAGNTNKKPKWQRLS